MKYRVGIDVGGTFTDCVIYTSSQPPLVVKEMTTYPDQGHGVVEAIAKGARALGADVGEFLGETEIIVHGTTVATNTILQYNGAKTGLICTRGFRDDIEKRRGYREENFFMKYPGPPQIAARRHRIGVTERIDYSGNVVVPLDEEEVRDAARWFRDEGIDAIAVSFLFSFTNSSHEQRTGEIIAEEHPSAHISLSCEVLPQIREFERVSTTVVNAYTSPALRRYLSKLTKRLQEKSFAGDLLIMQSGGGVVPTEYAGRMGVHALLSGPAGGVVSSAELGRRIHRMNLITVDMGGTSYDVSVIDGGRVEKRTDAWISRYKVAVPMLDIHTIGAGGGTIARIDAGGGLKVGPHSAGSDPGPACYAKGGMEPTVTDANLVLGYLSPVIGDNIPLDIEAATRAIREKIARPLSLSVTEAAFGIFRLVNEIMNDGIRVMSVKRGHDLREFALVACGGAGPIHAGIQALELGIPTVIVPKSATAFSALGLLLSELKISKSRSFLSLSDTLDLEDMEAGYHQLMAEIRSEFGGLGASDRQIESRYYIDMHYPSQTWEITVPVEHQDTHLRPRHLDEAVQRFHEQHRQLYMFNEPNSHVEIVNLRVEGVIPGSPIEMTGYSDVDRDSEAALKGTRAAYFQDQGGFVETPLYLGLELTTGMKISGPAIVEELGTTIVVYPGQQARVDVEGNYVLELSH